MNTSRHFLPSAAAMLSALCPFTARAGAPAASRIDGFPLPVITRFETFREADGLPSHKINYVTKSAEGALCLGTANGLCVRQPDGKFRRYGPKDGLSHPMVLGIAEDPASGDLWLATMSGLDRFSGGQFTVFTQTDSGLPNNVVYAVAIMDNTVWAATAAGTGSYNLKTKTWSIFDQTNSVMEEPWCYSVARGDGVVYLGVWAGGVVEHNPRAHTFKAYRDPDGESQIQLVPNSGPISDITSWVAYDGGILWQGSYFGLARYDTSAGTWRTWVQDKTPLVSNFVNTVFARHRVAWVATDRGVSVTDGSDWIDYLVGQDGQGVVRTYRAGQQPQTRTMATALADGFVMNVWADDHEAWFATSNGLSRGVFARPSATPAVTSNP